MSDFVIENGSLIRYNGSETDIVIPEMIGDSRVTKIGEMTFYWNNSITSIILPSSVTTIGMSAFESCGSLKSIEIPSSVSTIGLWTFENCPSLTIYAQAEKQPEQWAESWNADNHPVIWGYKK